MSFLLAVDPRIAVATTSDLFAIESALDAANALLRCRRGVGP
ncbi:hypothetical protein MB901379_01097 [Mycobacterium basiliense]|uniref:Uncharacterized protein n=1 Tax=Mycobacterium basiliense TaxID=2094119 RepID=A0A3S4BTV7_9MYCO|nr:hypothetical protein [Mycobacterium basiliense]VDM87553.1 hypothetical protein MB901379_01097 [Mycobacterium basiliense]